MSKRFYAGIEAFRQENISLITKSIDQLVNHEPIIQTGKHVRKSLVICATQLAGGLLLKMVKYFEVMLNTFEFSHSKEIVES